MKPAAHTRMGAVGLGSRLLGPTPARVPLAAPPAQASPRRAPRRGSWPSASRPAARRPAGTPGAARVLASVRAERKPPRRLAAFVPMETGAAAGADGSGRVSAGAAGGAGHPRGSGVVCRPPSGRRGFRVGGGRQGKARG